MAVAYRIYSNHGNGGPVDFSAPIAITAGLTYSTGPLGLSTDTTFVVRAYDTVTGIEEANTGPGVQIAVGADGTDASSLPNATHALTLSPAAGGGARVSWAYAPAGSFGTPTGFSVYLTEGTAANESSPAATVAYVPNQVGYSCVLPGPYALSAYTATVRSSNAAGVGSDVTPVTVTLGLPAPFAMEPVKVVGAVQNH